MKNKEEYVEQSRLKEYLLDKPHKMAKNEEKIFQKFPKNYRQFPFFVI